MEYRVSKENIKKWAENNSWLLVWEIQEDFKKREWELYFLSADGESYTFTGEGDIGCTGTE